MTKQTKLSSIFMSLVIIVCVISAVSNCIRPDIFAQTSMPQYAAGVEVWNLNSTEASALHAAGLNYIRMGVDFLDSCCFNQTYVAATGASLRMIGILDGWNLLENKSFTIKDWTNAISRATQIYPAINVWEIWDEPMIPWIGYYGYNDGSVQHYFNLLESAYTTLKAINANYVVIGLGGPSLANSTQLSWAQQLWTLGGANYCDAISVHAYPFNLNLDPVENWTYYQSLWTSYFPRWRNLGKPIWLTETGLQSNQKTPADQATYLNESYNFFKQQGVVLYSWYDLYSTGNEWGLLNSNGSPKAAYVTYLDLLQATSSTTQVTTSSTSTSSRLHGHEQERERFP